jgi:hypothetical protein
MAGNPDEESEYRSQLVKKDKSEDDELQALIDKYEEEESGKHTKFDDFEGGLSEDDDEDEDGYPDGYEDPDMFDAYGMDASEGKINEKNLDVDPEELKKGIEVEKEHTDDPVKAEEIALDHLAEDPHYYTKLAKAKLEEIKNTKFDKSSKPKYPNWTNASGKDYQKYVSPNSKVNLQSLLTGINIEHEENPEKSYEQVVKMVVKNLEKDPIYYTYYKLTGLRNSEPMKLDTTNTPEVMAMKAVKSDNLVDKGRGMRKVKLVKEARFNAMPGEEPNATVQHAIGFIQSNPVLRQISDDITLQNDGENAILKYGYWEALSDEAYNKLELQFVVEDDFESADEEANKIAYILYPKKKVGNLGASLEMGASKASKMDVFKETLESLVREVLAETFDGRDNLDAENEY